MCSVCSVCGEKTWRPLSSGKLCKLSKWVAMEGSTSYTKSHGMFGEWKLGSRSLQFGLSWPLLLNHHLWLIMNIVNHFKPLLIWFTSIFVRCIAAKFMQSKGQSAAGRERWVAARSKRGRKGGCSKRRGAPKEQIIFSQIYKHISYIHNTYVLMIGFFYAHIIIVMIITIIMILINNNNNKNDNNKYILYTVYI